MQHPTFPRPAGKPQFTAPWFRWFLPKLTLPEGTPMRWEGHTLLMTEEFFARDLVHLLVLIPKSNQKTTWEAALAVWHLLSVPAPRAYCAAADKEQAKELYDFAADFGMADGLAHHLVVRPSTLEIRTRVNPGRSAFKVLAQDDSKQGGKKQGKNLTLSLGDELHAWENRNLFVDLRSGGFKRREAARIAGDPLWWTLGKMGTITTEGFASDSVLATETAKFLGDPETGTAPMGTVETGLRVLPDGTTEKHPDGRLTIARYGNGRNVLLRWACKDTDDTSDSRVVKFANPASTATVESIDDARESLTPWEFLRYRANIRTIGFESWLPEDAWGALRSDDVPALDHRTWEDATVTGEVDDDGFPVLADEFAAHVAALFPPGTSVVGAIDMARYRDTAALVLIGRNEAGVKVPRALVWRSGGQDSPIRYEWVKAAARAVHRLYDLRACGSDPKYFDQSAEELADEGLPMEDFGQSTERIAPADTELRKEILQGEFAHDGDPILAAHIAAGKALDVGTNLFKIITQDGASPPPIDACRAFSMANAIEKWDTDSEPLGAWG